MRDLLRNLTLLGVILATLAVDFGCDRPAESAPGQGSVEPLKVVTPVYVIGDIVKQIGGNRVDVSWWVEAGQTLADLRETPERRNQLRSADLIITRGDLDPWTLTGMTSEYERRRVLRLDRLISAKDGDPTQYQWLDPSVMLDLADEVTARLSELSPAQEKMFRSNAAKFRGEVIAASERARPAMDAARGSFLTLDRGFVVLARRFSLTEARVEKINLADPTPWGVKVLKERAKETGARAIFVNDQTPGPLVRDWESRLELMVLPLDALGSSAPGSGRSTCVKVLEYNLGQLAKGMTPPPAKTP